jgi:hypothetical protein
MVTTGSPTAMHNSSSHASAALNPRAVLGLSAPNPKTFTPVSRKMIVGRGAHATL